jgi:HEAT repeat protein
VREYAVEALAHRANDPLVQQALLSMLDDSVRYVRIRAAEALNPLGGKPFVKQTIERLLLLMLADPYDEVRSTAAYSLTNKLNSYTDSPAIQAALLSLLEDPSDYIRRYAISALAGVVGKIVRTDEKVRDTVLARLGDTNYEVRSSAVRILTPSAGEHKVRQALRSVVFSDEKSSVRLQAACALINVDNDPLVAQVLVILMPGWHCSDSSISVAITRLTATSEGRQIIRTKLIEADGYTRRAIVRLLMRVQPLSEIRDVLAAMLDDWTVANEAFATLNQWAKVERG